MGDIGAGDSGGQTLITPDKAEASRCQQIFKDELPGVERLCQILHSAARPSLIVCYPRPNHLIELMVQVGPTGRSMSIIHS